MSEQVKSSGNHSDQNLEWAAYVIGRHPQAVRFWQAGLRVVADLEMPWDSSLQQWDIHCQSLDRVPHELFTEADAALAELAMARVVDAGLLVELHRQFDQIQESCQLFTEMVKQDDREGVDIEEAWEYGRWSIVGRITRDLIDGAEEYRKWAELGTNLGEWICILHDTSEPPSLPALERILALNDRKVLQERIEHLMAFARDIWDAQAGCYRVDNYTWHTEWIAQLTRFDQGILEVLGAGVGSQPLVVIDEKRNVLEFLGVSFDFDAFREGKASGGLHCFQVLAAEPMTRLTYQEIIERAEITVDEHRLAEYFSGFRLVLRPAIEKFLSGPERYARKLVENAFIEAKARKQKMNVPGTYRLAIPPNRVRVIRAT